jgi:hypothetical protein
MQVKAAETAKSLGITNCEHVCREEPNSDIQHLSAKEIPDDFHEKLLGFWLYVIQIRNEEIIRSTI